MTNSAGTLTPEELQTARERLSPRGRMTRQLYKRIRQFWPRQSMTFVGTVSLVSFVSLDVGILAVTIALLGELVDLLIMKIFVKKLKFNANFSLVRNMTALSGFIHALAIAACVMLAHFTFPDDQGYQFSLVFLFGATMSAGLFLAYHPWSAIARLSVFAATFVFLTFDHFISQLGVGGIGHIDAATAMILAMVTAFLLQFAYSNHNRQMAANRKVLDQADSLRLAQEARDLERRKARDLALVAQHANDSVIITDPVGAITWVNESFSRITGYSRTEALGQYPGALLNSENTDKEVVQLIIDKIQAGEQLRTEVLNKTKDGREIWIEINLVPVQKPDGSLDKVISIERDITEAREKADALANAKLAAEQSEKAKSEFLATISHEIRTPMNAILGTAELLEAANLPEEEMMFTKTIKESSAALLEILNDTLDLSKLEAGKLTLEPEPFDLHQTAEAAINLFRASAIQRGLELDLSIAKDVPRDMIGDAGRTRQILVNIIGNALKFTPEGSIRMSVRLRDNGDQSTIAFEINDTGIGIPNDRIDHIFEEFSQAEATTTRRFGGTGLGLTISRKLARMMGGDIVVSSEQGKGSAFLITLQYEIDPSAAREVAEPDSVLPDITGMQILAADDNATNLFLLSKYFADQSVKFATAEDGQKAIELAANSNPDIILMDMSMPDVDGPTAAAQIRRLKPPFAQPVIIALTANVSAEDHQKCLDAGMDDVLTKPIRKADLIRKLGEYKDTANPKRAISL